MLNWKSQVKHMLKTVPAQDWENSFRIAVRINWAILNHLMHVEARKECGSGKLRVLLRTFFFRIEWCFELSQRGGTKWVSARISRRKGLQRNTKMAPASSAGTCPFHNQRKLQRTNCWLCHPKTIINGWLREDRGLWTNSTPRDLHSKGYTKASPS